MGLVVVVRAGVPRDALSFVFIHLFSGNFLTMMFLFFIFVCLIQMMQWARAHQMLFIEVRANTV